MYTSIMQRKMTQTQCLLTVEDSSTMTIRLPIDIKEKISEVAKKEGVKPGTFGRQAIISYLEEFVSA